MKKNMSSADAIIRIVVAIAIAALYFTKVISGTLAIILIVLGVVFLLTSVVRFCPLYSLFGISTCPTKESKMG